MQLSQVFSQHALPVMSKCIYCYKCVSDKKVKFKKIKYVYIHDIVIPVAITAIYPSEQGVSDLGYTQAYVSFHL